MEEEKEILKAIERLNAGKSSQELTKEVWERNKAAQGDGPPTSDDEDDAGKFAAKRATDDEKKRSASQASVRSDRSNRSTTSLRARSVLADEKEEEKMLIAGFLRRLR